MIGFDKHGSGDRGVIVLNDWLSDTSTWDEARRYLGREDFTWVFADLRGYGRSRGQGGRFTIIEAAGDVIALADSLGWGRFAIVGHSMSALVALHLAQHHPNRVERTVLVTPSPPRGFGFDDVTMQALRAGASGDDAARLGLLRRMQGTRLTEQWIRLKLERWRMSSDSEAVAGYTSMWAREGLPDPEAKVASPLLAITGEDDREDMRADATSAALRPLASDLTVVPLADCGHAPMPEMPPLFATVVCSRPRSCRTPAPPRRARRRHRVRHSPGFPGRRDAGQAARRGVRPAPPDALTVPWPYVATLMAIAAVAVVAAVVWAGRIAGSPASTSRPGFPGERHITQDRSMTFRFRHLLLPALLVASLSGSAQDVAPSSDEDSCRPDVFRLCAGDIPDETRIVAPRPAAP